MWLLDTGAPASFGNERAVTIAGERFPVSGGHLGLTTETLSRFVAVECTGLLGADVLGHLDFVFDVPNQRIAISTGELECSGTAIDLDEYMGIPIAPVRIRGTDYRMFFDTGAQLSFFEHESLASFPVAGRVADFYPGLGQFETETHDVSVTLGGLDLTLRCGALPEGLGATLMMAGTNGIIGNQLLGDRRVGYFPRRHALVF